MTGKRCVLPREVSSAQESAVTTNDEKSAEAIVGGNTEGPNEIQFMSFRIVCQFHGTVWGQAKCEGEGWKLNKRRKGVNNLCQLN